MMTAHSERVSRIDTRYLAAFSTIAREGSFRSAARKLGYTQSAISQHVGALEAALGMQLFDRPGGRRPVSLTEAGKVVLPLAEEILERLNALENHVDAYKRGAAGRVVVGTFQSVATHVLPQLVKALRERHPGIDVGLVESTGDDDLLRRLGAGEIDVAFVDLPLDTSRFDVTPLYEDPFVLVVPVRSEIARRPSRLGLADICARPLIAPNVCRRWDAIEEQLRAMNPDLQIVFRSDDNATVHALVASGIGVSLRPSLAVDRDDPRTVIREVDDADVPARLIGAAVRRQSPRSPVISEIVQLARAILIRHARRPVDLEPRPRPRVAAV